MKGKWSFSSTFSIIEIPSIFLNYLCRGQTVLVTPEYHGLFLFGGKKAWGRDNKRGGGWDGHKWICLFAWIVTKLVDVEMELTNQVDDVCCSKS